jgi:hypothetical protein
MDFKTLTWGIVLRQGRTKRTARLLRLGPFWQLVRELGRI